MSRSLVLSFVLAALSLMLNTPCAQACSCLKERSELEQRLRSADLVVFGTIAELRTEGSFHHLTVQIAHVLKGGALGERIEIVTAIDDGLCGVEVAAGESYLLWPGWLSWPSLDQRHREIDTCNGGYRRMSPAEFEAMRAELEAAVADTLQDAGADAGTGDAGNAVSTASVQASSAAPTSDDEAEGCALAGRQRNSSAAWPWLTALGILARSRSRRRRSPAPAP